MRPAGTPESEPKSPTRKARRGEAGQACEELSFTVAVRNVDRPSGPPTRSRKGSAGVSPAPVGVPPTARPPHPSASHPPTLSTLRRATEDGRSPCYAGRQRGQTIV